MELKDEYEFISKLPVYYMRTVLDRIHKIFDQKLNIINDCSENMFIEIYRNVNKRKSIENEKIIEIGEKVTHIYMV